MRPWIRCSPLLLAAVAAAQNVESVALLDAMDSRATADRLTARLAELSREATLQQQLGNGAAAATIQGIVASLTASRTGVAPPPQPTGLEVHVVSFYEGDNHSSTTQGTATVALDRPGAAVLLVCNAYESTTWTITATPGTALIGVVAFSYDPQTIQGPAGVPVVAIDLNGGGTYWGGADELEARFDVAAWTLQNMGAFPRTFTGAYTAPPPAVPFALGPTSGEWLEQIVLAAAIDAGNVWNVATRANAFAAFAGQRFLPLLNPPTFSFGSATLALASPVQVLQPLLPIPGVTDYALSSSQIFVLSGGRPSVFDLGSLTATAIPPDPTLPAFSFVNTIAFDLVRNRLLVSSFGGTGYLYAFDVGTGAWSVVTNWNNQDVQAIAYHPVYDATFALHTGGFGGGPWSLRRHDGNGALVATVPLALRSFHEFIDEQHLYVLGTNLVLVGPPRAALGLSIRHAIVIEPNTGDVLFAGFLLG